MLLLKKKIQSYRISFKTKHVRKVKKETGNTNSDLNTLNRCKLNHTCYEKITYIHTSAHTRTERERGKEGGERERDSLIQLNNLFTKWSFLLANLFCFLPSNHPKIHPSIHSPSTGTQMFIEASCKKKTVFKAS